MPALSPRMLQRHTNSQQFRVFRMIRYDMPPGS